MGLKYKFYTIKIEKGFFFPLTASTIHLNVKTYWIYTTVISIFQTSQFRVSVLEHVDASPALALVYALNQFMYVFMASFSTFALILSTTLTLKWIFSCFVFLFLCLELFLSSQYNNASCPLYFN